MVQSALETSWLPSSRWLSKETIKVRREVDHDELLDASIKSRYTSILNAAAEWDTGLTIALGAWEDAMQPGTGLDAGNEKAIKEDDDRRMVHARYLIGLMRAKCIEALKKRNVLSPQL